MKIRTLINEKDYTSLTKDQQDLICNGCGPSGWKNNLVPETIYGVNIKLACQIHDVMYFNGLTKSDKMFADEFFEKNMNIIFDSLPWYKWHRYLNPLRRRRAHKYYLAVKWFGEKSFLEGKHGFQN